MLDPIYVFIPVFLSVIPQDFIETELSCVLQVTYSLTTSTLIKTIVLRRATVRVSWQMCSSVENWLKDCKVVQNTPP